MVLTERETYLAIKRLYIKGWSEQAIAKAIGKSRSYVQRRVWLTKMPDAIVERWLDGKLTDKELTALAKANTAGTLAGVWQELLDGMDITIKPGEEPRSKEGILRTASQIRLMAERKSLTKSARNALLWVLCERDTV